MKTSTSFLIHILISTSLSLRCKDALKRKASASLFANSSSKLVVSLRISYPEFDHNQVLVV